jgi:hypothetical protein
MKDRLMWLVEKVRKLNEAAQCVRVILVAKIIGEAIAVIVVVERVNPAKQ